MGRRRDDARRSALVGPGRRRARAPGAALRTRLAARVPRDHLRLARRRGRSGASPGKSVGTYFRDEIAAPLGLDFWIGLPEVGGAAGRAARRRPRRPGPRRPTPRCARSSTRSWAPTRCSGKALFAPGGALSAPDVWNSRALHAAEIPAAGGIGDARSLARHVLGVHRHRRRHAPPRRRAAPTRDDAADDRSEHGAARHGHPVRSGLHAALDAHRAGRSPRRSVTSARADRSAGPIPTPSSRSAT